MAGKSKMTRRGLKVNRKPKVSINIKKYVKNAIQAKKETTVDVDASAPADIQASTTGDVINLTSSAFDGSHGDGVKLKVQSIELRGRMNSTSTNTDSLRMMLVRSKTQEVPTFAELFTFPSTYAILKPNREKDFEVLFDRRYNIDIVQRKQHFFQIKKYVGKTIQKEVGSSTIMGGDVYLMILGSLTSASTNGAVIKYDKIVSFKDF